MLPSTAAKVDVRGVFFDNVTLAEAADRLRGSAAAGVRETVFI